MLIEFYWGWKNFYDEDSPHRHTRTGAGPFSLNPLFVSFQ